MKKNIKVALSSQINGIFLNDGPAKIGNNTYFKGTIGSYSYIGPDCRLNADIGKFCSISAGVITVEGMHPVNRVSTSPVFYSPHNQCNTSFTNSLDFDDLLFIDKVRKIACRIGNDVWIGENVSLKGGITIGNGACIAMGAVVTKDVPPYSIVGGVPAKIIRMRFCEEQIKILERSQWWDREEDWLIKNKESFTNIDQFIVAGKQ